MLICDVYNIPLYVGSKYISGIYMKQHEPPKTISYTVSTQTFAYMVLCGETYFQAQINL
uniref:Uncharacterized protein n=1 Tax=Octopus bimaculoides TaxID=37653 RepID=A0A0L8GZZ1_OCTBM